MYETSLVLQKNITKEIQADTRNITIDILKTLGIILVILAHTNPPTFIFQLRNFDVVLLVILSGSLAIKSYNKSKNFKKYFEKRILRLAIPVIVMLSAFFGGGRVLCTILNKEFPFSFKKLIFSFFLLDVIGYVWIIRVYILCALSIPIIEKIKKSLSTKEYYLFIISLYILYEILYYFIGNNNLFLKYIVYYIIPYGFLCSFIGIELNRWNNKTILIISMILIIIFGITATIKISNLNTFVTTNEAKYPARLYYLSYAIGMSLLCYYFVDRKNIFNIKRIFNNSKIVFISGHTMWIYLWHIIYIFIINFIKLNLFWLFEFLIILLMSIFTTYLQSKVVNKINIKNKEIKIIFDS